MTRRTRIILGAGGTAAVLLIALFFFARHELTKSFPPVSGSARLSGLLNEVRVMRDPYGVPHIQATNEHDALFALGVVHAQDRLWQMDMQRRAASGRLSVLFGNVTLPYDRMFRIIGLRRIAERIEAQLPDDTRRRLQWYADGVNAWMDASRGRYPVEFDMLRYDPEPWTPLHSIMTGRLIAWELNLSWWTDITYGILEEKLGPELVQEILPSYPPGAPPFLPPATPVQGASAGLAYLRTAQQYRAFMGRPLMPGGSNAWAVSPLRSTTGGALLANDTHLHLTSPSQWYEVGYDIPGSFVRGMSIPGVPGIVTGRNDSIAWGVTNLMADEADFFIEDVDDSTETYRTAAGRVPLRIIEEEIEVRDELPVEVRIRFTAHGPIVTDIETPLNRAQPGFVASMRWTGTEPDDQVGTFLKINRSRSWPEFLGALRGFTVPGQNFIYADTRGNIGHVCAARIPLRISGRGLLPRPGWDPGSGWRGFVPFDQLPRVFNPPSGYVASANNKVVDDRSPLIIGDLWEPPSRIERLHAVLGAAGTRFGVRDFEQLQNDTYSPFARDLLPVLHEAFADSVVGSAQGERIRTYFANWHVRFDREDIATTIYQTFLNNLLRNMYQDEMGEEVYHDFAMLVNVPMRVTVALLAAGTSRWFDDVRTPAVETRADILGRSARDALRELTARFGDDTRRWRWADLHTVTLPHPLGSLGPLDRLFNIGPFGLPGGSTSMMSGEYKITEPYAVTVGASYRQIFDMADPVRHRSILPSGQSGQVLHVHYDDQTPLWLLGQYKTVTFTADPGGRDELVLVPEGER